MKGKLALAVVIAAVIAAYFAFDGQRFVSVDYFQGLYRQDPWLTAGIFFAVYFLSAAFSLPAAAVLTVVAGMIFGLGVGTLLVSFASALGATVACTFSRFILRDWVQETLSGYLRKIDEGVEKDGANYLFTLRLIPVFPFWVINLAFGLTRLPLTKFYLVSQLGMLPGTMVYVNAGAQLGAVEEFSLQGIMTPGLLGSFVLLALFPNVVKKMTAWWQQRQCFKAWPKPKKFDTNLIVIGAGSGGLVTAYIAATVKARVTLIEKHLMGGDCLNTGCVPSKALLRAAKAAAEIRRAPALGIEVAEPTINFEKVMAHVHGAVKNIEPHDSVERYTELGVDCITGAAKLVSPWAVEVNGQTLTAPNIVIASGASPKVPDIPGLKALDYLTSENLWSITERPDRLLVMGGGPIGCEMALAFQRLGSRVTLVQRPERLLPKEDPEASQLLARVLADEGVAVLTGWQVTAFDTGSEGPLATITRGEQQQQIGFDRVLVALGRQANTTGLGLEGVGIDTRADGTVAVNDYLQTSCHYIYACGDVCGPYQFTHASAHQAWYAAVNSLFGRFKKFRADYRLMPSVVYTEPEVASVGLNESTAREQGVEYEVTLYSLDDSDRAITDRETEGFVKILTPPGKDKILGVTIVASHAGEMLTEFVTAMKHGKGLNSILGTIHPYPVLSEANKMAAGVWKKNHAPQKLLAWVEKFHRWQRGVK